MATEFKLSYTGNQINEKLKKIDNLADKSELPTKISELTNDSGFITNQTEADPTVPAWAKAASKPTYTASEVGADASGTASNLVSVHNTASNAHSDIREQISQLYVDKADKSAMTLGVHTDGFVYLFINGVPQGNGLDIKADVIEGDVFGYVDENNVIVLNGALADGTYTIKYEMENGSTVEIGDLVLDNNVYYSITNTLTNCINSNSATQAVQGGSYSATITAKSGYEMSSIKVTMGGSDISSSAVNGGKVTIANVTGNIVITAIAEAQASRTNFFDASSGFYGRLSSSGADRTDSTVLYVTNYIAVQNGDIVEISGCCLGATNQSGVWYTTGYDANKANVHTDGSYESNNYWTVDTHTTANAQLTVISDSIKYFRFTLGHTDGNSKVDTNTVIINIKRNGQWL